ncbi:mRNA interferase RelE [uncultured Gammaproteobacteria bacterium]|uniref:type II toxin-antitoxin system RelE family toxin n=1 Tax=Bathymodiolus heckerae thiotrophic gill symbiont TaxID=1052212 RepID=UPI0010B068BF|nr:type II toxin-antitoxin system RelE/ParE family toxin [Bathymodiolus heckerae thiotrophic gill symbiont]CAC9455874.1 mRNA interferase RelE [uncultured Gammaproteobacteria bacterium]SMN13495.1 RelE/StbE replicon stabilization toxin [Bathymodiolus heckerae thiotrophic gill symbiont]
MYRLSFDDKVIKDLRKINKSWQARIIKSVKTKLVENPHLGKKLVGNLSPYYRYGVGNYRVLYEINDEEITVFVVKIKHRKNIYK